MQVLRQCITNKTACPWPLAQRVTSPSKVPTWLLPDCVAKGPYAPGSVVPRLVVARHAAHTRLGNACVTPPRLDGEYVVYDYVVEPVDLHGPVQDADYEWRGVHTRVLDRAGFPTVQVHKWVGLGGAAADVLFHLALCYALGSGDVGLWNILAHARTGRVVGIDMEDFRMRPPEQPASVWEALFTRGVPRAHQGVFNDFLTTPGRPALADRLRAAAHVAKDMEFDAVLRVAPGQVERRLQTVARLLEEWTPEQPKAGPRKPKAKREPQAGPGKPEAQREPKAKRPRTSGDSAGSGAPSGSGCVKPPSILTARSPHGHGFFDLASALQKCVRRGMADTACQVLTDGLEAGPPVSTGLLNRLRVIALEDVGLANLPLALGVLAALAPTATSAQLSPELAAQLAMGAAAAMAASPKTRVLSLLYNTHCTPEGRAHAAVPPLAASDTFDSLLAARDPRVLAWVQQHVNFGRVAEGRAYFRRFAPYLPGDALALLEAAYVERKVARDVRVFYLTPLLAVLFDVPAAPWVRIQPLPRVPFHLAALPEFALDMHTAAGRARGCTQEQFALEGAALAGEWNPPGLDVARLKDTYVHVKRALDAKAKGK